MYPPREKLFAALNTTPPEQVRVVILGQDPYHEPGQAHGLSFSVEPGVTIPKSLNNIYKELEADLGLTAPQTGCLLPWAGAWRAAAELCSDGWRHTRPVPTENSIGNGLRIR